MPKQNIKEIPYVRSDGKSKKAVVIPVDFSLEGLNNEEIQVLWHLSKASDYMAPIFARQHYDKCLELLKELINLEKNSSGGRLKKLKDYNDIFTECNSPWFTANDLGIKFPLKKSSILKEYVSEEFIKLLTNNKQAPLGRALYPLGLTEKEIDSLSDPLRVNSSVIEDKGGKLKIILHEKRYKKELEPVIKELEKAKEKTKNKSLRAYMEAKINELKTGSLESREESNKKWLELNGNLDFIIGTGIETYLDRIKGMRGCAQAIVCKTNKKYDDFCEKILKMLPEMEKEAPWKNKKKIDISNVPKLRFLDVATWSGFYDAFPAVIVAEALPNEESFKKKYGSVNVVCVNIQKSLSKYSKKLLRKEFLPKSAIKKYGKYLTHMGLIMTAAHELGHSSGGVVIDEDTNDYFGKEYSVMEEARAELFSMWSLPLLVEKGIINKEEEMAGYYYMVLSMIGSLQSKPIDHSGSRNLMFHYFTGKKAIKEIKEEGKIKYDIDIEKLKNSTAKLLKIIGNIRATGNKDGLKKLKSKYISEARKEEFEKRMGHMPQGKLLIFPNIKMKDGKLTNKLVYPKTFREQARTLNNFV